MHIWLAILGACLGSFLGVLAERLPKGEDVVFTRSRCSTCYHCLSWYELIPIFSFVMLKGRCRHCQVCIPKKVFLFEVFMGGSLLWYSFIWDGDWMQLSSTLLLLGIISLVSVIDLESKEIYLLPLWIVGILQLILISMQGSIFERGKEIIVELALSGCLYGSIYGLSYLMYQKEVFGLGDMYYLMVLSLFSKPGMMVQVGMESFLWAGGFLFFKWILSDWCPHRQETFAFAPFISLAMCVRYFNL